jgi:hypothetical protein
LDVEGDEKNCENDNKEQFSDDYDEEEERNSNFRWYMITGFSSY